MYRVHSNRLSKLTAKVLLFVMLSCTMFYSATFTVRADEDPQTQLNAICSSMGRGNVDIATFNTIYQALKTTGFNDYECSAILVNLIRESTLRPDAGQSGGRAIGLAQWDGGRRDNLQTYSQQKGDTQYTINGYQIGGIGTQCSFLLSELVGGQWLSKAPVPLYTKLNKTEADSAINDSSIDLTQAISKEQWRGMTNVIAMSLYFTSQFERCAYNIDIYNIGARQAPDMYKLCTGTAISNTGSEGGAPIDESLANEIAENAAEDETWDEEQFGKFKAMCESAASYNAMQTLSIDDLNDDQRSALAQWKDNVSDENQQGGLWHLGRLLVVFVGILAIIWGSLLFIGYHIDVNMSIIPFRLTKLLSLGHFVAVTDDDMADFYSDVFSTDGKGGKVKPYNFKKIMAASLVAIIAGILCVTGQIFTLVYALVYNIWKFAGNFFSQF